MVGGDEGRQRLDDGVRRHGVEANDEHAGVVALDNAVRGGPEHAIGVALQHDDHPVGCPPTGMNCNLC